MTEVAPEETTAEETPEVAEAEAPEVAEETAEAPEAE